MTGQSPSAEAKATKAGGKKKKKLEFGEDGSEVEGMSKGLKMLFSSAAQGSANPAEMAALISAMQTKMGTSSSSESGSSVHTAVLGSKERNNTPSESNSSSVPDSAGTLMEKTALKEMDLKIAQVQMEKDKVQFEKDMKIAELTAMVDSLNVRMKEEKEAKERLEERSTNKIDSLNKDLAKVTGKAAYLEGKVEELIHRNTETNDKYKDVKDASDLNMQRLFESASASWSS